jgi:hypothetical protein
LRKRGGDQHRWDVVPSRVVLAPWGALGCAAVLALLASHGLAQQNATFNSYWVDDGWLNLPDGRRMGLATKVALDRDGKSLWVFDRCGAVDCVGSVLDPIAKFDPLGSNRSAKQNGG